MGKKVYNKLVRSEIPTIIKESGKEAIYGKLTLGNDREEIVKLLKEKLVEEAQEVIEAVHKGDILEELGDLESVLYNLKRALLVGDRDIDTVKQAKCIKNGYIGNTFEDSSGGTATLPNRNGYDLEFIKLISVDDNGQETKD